jgi:APA family basic amino acid/polyamine antiporter
VGTLIIAVMIMISTFACNNGLIMAGARVYYDGQDGVFLKKRKLNKASVPEWSIWAVYLGFGFVFDGKYGDLLDFVIMCLIFYILLFWDFYFRKKNANAGKSV